MFSFLLEFLFPKRCLITGTPGSYLSPEAKKRLISHPEMCPVSHRPSPDFLVLPTYRDRVDYEGCIIGFSYTPEIKKAIFKLKYDHRYTLALFLVDRLVRSLSTNASFQKYLASGSCVVTSVPSHRWRKYVVKGYNQSELLAKLLAKKLGVLYLPLVKKIKHTSSQATLSRFKRLQNLEDAFEIIPYISLPKNSTIVIVDDIFTTGTTLQKISSLIKKFFPSTKIWGLMIAHNG